MGLQENSTPKSTELERRHTTLRGGSARQLQQPEEKANEYDIPFPRRPPRSAQKRPFPVNTSNHSFEPIASAEVPAKRVKPAPREESRTVYHKFMTLDQAGPATVASDSTKFCALVAIKRSHVKSNDRIPPIKGFPAANVVNLIDIFREDEEIYMVYEQMDVSLRAANGISQGCWNSHEIAAICKEVSRRSILYQTDVDRRIH